jgi:hypothetical protein
VLGEQLLHLYLAAQQSALHRRVTKQHARAPQQQRTRSDLSCFSLISFNRNISVLRRCWWGALENHNDANSAGHLSPAGTSSAPAARAPRQRGKTPTCPCPPRRAGCTTRVSTQRSGGRREHARRVIETAAPVPFLQIFAAGGFEPRLTRLQSVRRRRRRQQR